MSRRLATVRHVVDRDLELEQLRWSLKWMEELRLVLIKHLRRSRQLDRDLAEHNARMIADVPLHWPSNDPRAVLDALRGPGKPMKT